MDAGEVSRASALRRIIYFQSDRQKNNAATTRDPRSTSVAAAARRPLSPPPKNASLFFVRSPLGRSLELLRLGLLGGGRDVLGVVEVSEEAEEGDHYQETNRYSYP